MKFSHFVSSKAMYSVEIHGYKRLHMMASGYEEPNINVSAINTFIHIDFTYAEIHLNKPT